MALDFNQRSYTKSVDQAAIDEGLRAYMLKVYNYMTTGLVLTGFIAYFFGKASVAAYLPNGVALTPLGNILFNSGLAWIIMLAPLGFVFYLSARINRMSSTSAQITFWIFASVMGLSLASIFIQFTGESIARVFFIAASMFLTMSIWGYTTKRSLAKMGSFLMMGLIGLIIASIVNIFLGSSALQFAMSIIGVIIFAGLTAYDTQVIKEIYVENENSEESSKKAVMGALKLYLDLLLLFQYLLMLFGNRE